MSHHALLDLSTNLKVQYHFLILIDEMENLHSSYTQLRNMDSVQVE